MKEFLHKKLSLCTSNQVSNQENPLEGIPTQKNMAEGIPTLKMSSRGPGGAARSYERWQRYSGTVARMKLVAWNGGWGSFSDCFAGLRLALEVY